MRVDLSFVLAFLCAPLVGCSASADPPTAGLGVPGAGATGTGAPGSGGSGNGTGAVGAGGGAVGGGTGTGTGAGPATTHCTNAVKDQDETDVDCGGATCPSCTAEYKINPPDPCQNQFYFDPATAAACGAKEPRNACENAPSKDGKIGFACSRYMMFSKAMLQAAEDDARANAWPNPMDPPFFYAVAGHDTNSGGVDAGMTGTQPCCECYQLVLVAPHNEGDAQNNQSPVPKPLVVQVFNTGATTQSFDLYMGAGGLGAFNGCSAAAGVPLSGGVGLYTAYPPDGQANNGGVKFRSYDECRTTTNEKASTPASISSPTCQGKIAAACNLVDAPQSVTLTNTTRSSCIRSNQLETLYHQNWDVYVRRVECPANLTRVTGCKLQPQAGLPAVDASIVTAAQAQAAGFLSGYHTTTMQDCCKPTCAWQPKVGGNEANKLADPLFSNIYSCDQNDQPFVKP